MFLILRKLNHVEIELVVDLVSQAFFLILQFVKTELETDLQQTMSGKMATGR